MCYKEIFSYNFILVFCRLNTYILSIFSLKKVKCLYIFNIYMVSVDIMGGKPNYLLLYAKIL